MKASTSPGRNDDRARWMTYVLVALAALFTGYLLGLLGEQSSGGSRVGWPPPPASPRSLNP